MLLRFASLAALADHFDAVSARLPATETAALHAIGASVTERAQKKFGHYQSGWAALHETTLAGWRGHPGKIDLGYAPPDNPLLRTRYMANSVSWDVAGSKKVTVGNKDPKSLFHELGTSKMAARPSIGPAMMENKAQNITLLGVAVTRVFRTR